MNRYADHTFIVLTLQKLVHLHDDCDSESDDGSVNKPSRGRFSKAIHNIFS